MYREEMFLNPVIRAKTYEVFGTSSKPIGEVNASDVHEAMRTAREEYGKKARVVVLKKVKP